MLSRIADSLFWLNRYLERTDTMARLIYVQYILSLDRTAGRSESWKPVLELCSGLAPDQIEKLQYDMPRALETLLVNASDNNSIISLVRRARENARGAQDHITKEVWEVINQMYHYSNQSDLRAQLRGAQALKVVESFARYSVLYEGTAENTMSRGLGWNFMRLGRYLERCMQTIAITRKELQRLAGKAVESTDIFQWRQLLFSLSGHELHLKTYRTNTPYANVLHQVLVNEDFTRSVQYALKRISHYLENIMDINEDHNAALARMFGKLNSKVQYLDLSYLKEGSAEKFLEELQADLLIFGNQLSAYYFSYS